MAKYFASWEDFSVSWRDLTWSEYLKFKHQFDSSPFVEPVSVALEIYKLVCIDGPDPKFVPAGIPCFICKQQMINNPFSGRFEDIAPALDIARQTVISNYLLTTKGIIASTLNYKPEEIDEWDATKFFIRLAQTELALGKTLDPSNPKAQSNRKSRPNRVQKPLTLAQQKAIDRTRERDRGV